MSRTTKETAYAIGYTLLDRGLSVDDAEEMATGIAELLYPEDKTWCGKFKELVMEAWGGRVYHERL